MEAIKLIEVKKQYDSYCYEAMELKTELEKLRVDLEQIYKKRFDSLQTDFEETVKKLFPMIKNLCVLSNNLLSIEKDRILFNGQMLSSYHYDEKNCFEVYAKAKNTLIQSANLIILKKSNVTLAAKSVAESYCTIIDIGHNIRTLKEKCIQLELARKEKKLLEIKEEIGDIERKYGNIDTALDTAIKDCKSIQDGLLLQNDTDINKQFPLEIHLPIGCNYSEINGNRIITSQINWSLEEDGICCIRTNGVTLDKEETVKVVENIVLRFLCSYPDTAKKIRVCNWSGTSNQHLSSFFALLDVTSAENKQNVFYNKDSTSKLEDNFGEKMLESLSNEINTRFSLLHGYRNILEYNMKHQDNVQPLIMVVLYGCSQVDFHKSHFENILKSGRTAGIYLLLLENEDKQDLRFNEVKIDISDYTKNVFVFSIDKGGFLTKGAEKYYTDLFGKDLSIRMLTDRIVKSLDEDKRVIPLKSIIQLPPEKQTDFSKLLSIPIGKSGDNIINLNIDIGQQTHVVFAGATGSGKSSLLCDIVLSTAYNYSPEKVEFWLLDFKHGATFSRFDRLKHVKMMALDNEEKDTDRIIGYIMQEIDRRGDIFKKEGQFNDIFSYNSFMAKNGKPLMPRLVICIDEYTSMKSKNAIPKLVEIARQGRSHGMHLVLCAQSEGDRAITSQAMLRFEFDNQKYSLLEDRIKAAENAFLKMRPGNCIFSTTGLDITRMRVAFAGKDDQLTELIEEINARYPEIHYQKPIIMDVIERNVLDPKNELKLWDENEVQSKYKKSLEEELPELLIPIGATRLRETVYHRISKKNPILFLLGNEIRVASVEYSLALCFSRLPCIIKNVFYCDLESLDRVSNRMRVWESVAPAQVEFGVGGKDFNRILSKVYSIYEDRKKREDKGIEEPIEFMIHCAEKLPAVLDKNFKKEADDKYDSISAEDALAELEGLGISMGDFDLSLLGKKKQQSDEKEAQKKINKVTYESKEITPQEMFDSIYKDGGQYSIFMTMHFDFKKKQDFANITKEIGCTIPDDVIIIPPIPKENMASATLLDKYLVAIKPNDYVMRSINLKQHEFIPAVYFNNDVSTEIIPYEWEVK